jgi:hypothetical protein
MYTVRGLHQYPELLSIVQSRLSQVEAACFGEVSLVQAGPTHTHAIERANGMPAGDRDSTCGGVRYPTGGFVWR